MTIEPGRDPLTPAQRLALAIRRFTRPRPAIPEPPLTIEPPPEPTPDDWRQATDRRLTLLEEQHDTTARRQVLIILGTITADIALEILKRNR